jgi:hypothetical protein
MLRDALRLCLDRRVIASLVGIGLAVALLAPDRLLAVVPLLIVLACPASMIVMAWTMRPSRTTPAGELGQRHAEDIRAELALLEARRSELQAALAADRGPGSGAESSSGGRREIASR